MLKKSFLLVVLMSLIGTVVSLGAQELPPSTINNNPLTSTVGNDTQIGGGHTLYATYAKYNNTTTIVGGGWQRVDDATTATCPAGGGSCSIEFDQYVQIGSGATGDAWAICSQVDGVFVSTPGCTIQGYTHVPGGYFSPSARSSSLRAACHPARIRFKLLSTHQPG